jgi:hypothetical protein
MQGLLHHWLVPLEETQSLFDLSHLCVDAI